MILTNACLQRYDRKNAKVNLKYEQFCQKELLILDQDFIMKRVNYFLFIGFIYFLQEGCLVCIFHACILLCFPLVLGGSHFLTTLSLLKPVRSHPLFLFLNTCLGLYRLVLFLLILLQIISFVGCSFICIYTYSF